jgi:hypothetical protein
VGEEEGISRYFVAIRKREETGNEGENTMSQFLENWL